MAKIKEVGEKAEAKKETTDLERVNEILSQDLSSMDAQGRTVILQSVLDLAMKMTEIGVKAQISPDGPVMITMDLRPQEKSSGIIA